MFNWLKRHRRRIRQRQREALARGPLFGSGQGRSGPENAEHADAVLWAGKWLLITIAACSVLHGCGVI